MFEKRTCRQAELEVAAERWILRPVRAAEAEDPDEHGDAVRSVDGGPVVDAHSRRTVALEPADDVLARLRLERPIDLVLEVENDLFCTAELAVVTVVVKGSANGDG